MIDNELPKVAEFLKQDGMEVCSSWFFYNSNLVLFHSSFQVSLAPFATKWLMTVFCNVLPLETTLRLQP
jgi:hypothetical protein